MIDSGMICSILFMNHIGLGVIREALQSAEYYVHHSNTANIRNISTIRKVNRGIQSFIFVSGTGLHTVINYYHLAYDADELKNKFFSIIGRRDLIE